MKAQISRQSHDPDRRYSGVYQQQGRMITDADWNELVDVLRARLRDALVDIVGDGAPKTGGLRLDGDRRIVPGSVYGAGIRAELRAAAPVEITSQPDFPLAPALPKTGDVVVYADLWDRTVDLLSDPSLADPGLHGADTCVRTRTMLQVKWCRPPLDPCTPADNPPQGDALVGLKLPPGVDTSDAVARLGNYVFRVEVHDLRTAADGLSAELTLKWSSENGAEQHSLVSHDADGREHLGYDGLPPEFVEGAWVYEVFNDTSEMHLGVHLAEGFVPARGVLDPCTDGQGQPVHALQLEQTPPKIGGQAAAAIRRWDGALTLGLARSDRSRPWKLANKAWLGGWDKGQVLRIVTGAPQLRGDVSLDGGICTAWLEGLILSLDTRATTFVAGDHWLAVVREEAPHGHGTPPVDERVVVAGGGRPVGVRHHAVWLATLRDGKTIAEPPGSPAQRRLAFPPLTALDAGTVHWQPEACAGPDSVGQRLPSTATAVPSDATVALALKALLCELDAGTLPYDRSSAVGKSVKDLAVLRTGDTVDGDLTVKQTLKTLRLKLEGPRAPLAGDVIMYNASSELAEWTTTPLTAWKLTGSHLATGSQIDAVTLGKGPDKALHVDPQGRVGIGTLEPQAPLHIVTAINDPAIDFPGFGMKWSRGQHIADGPIPRMWGLTGLYGRLTTWSTDCLFVGLHDAGSDRKDAVICWGDNQDESLRFLFAGAGDTVNPPPPVEHLRIRGDGGVLIPHGHAGGSSAAALEVGSQASMSGLGTPNGRIGFPGYDVRHGQLRWVPAQGRFELIDSSPKSPSGDFGNTPPGFVGLRARDAELESLVVGSNRDAVLTVDGSDVPGLHVDESGSVGIGTRARAGPRLTVGGNVVVEGDLHVIGTVRQWGQTMVLAKKDIEGLALQPSSPSNVTPSYGGTAFQLDASGTVRISLSLIGTPQSTSQQDIPVELLLHTPGATLAQTIIGGLRTEANGVLTREVTLTLEPGLHLLELRDPPSITGSAMTVQTVTLLVTAVAAPETSQLFSDAPSL